LNLKTFFFIFLICYCQVADAQVRRLGVLGSSTANGQGVPFDSSWVQLAGAYYRSSGIIDTIHKVAASTYDCYSGMPTGYVPPTGRNPPNASYNITRLMTRTPRVSTVIVNYPTTNFNIFSDAEILFCLDSIRKYANLMGARCYIATTQPRDNFDSAGRARLKNLNNTIRNYFGDSAIDFFTVLNNPANNKIRPEFALGDGVHVNSKGHAMLFRQVLNKNIFNIDTSSLERVLIDIGNAASATTVADRFGRSWNNMTDARKGLRISNAVTTTKSSTTIKLEVISPFGSIAADNSGVGSSGSVGDVYQYPASATNDHAFASTSISNGRWRIFGLDTAKTYSIRFWGSQMQTGYRILQVKQVNESTWQEYNAGMSKNYNTAATFSFTGKTEMSFDFRVKSGSVMGHVNVVDIVSNYPVGRQSVNQPPVSNAGQDTQITLPTDSVILDGNDSGDPEGKITGYQWQKVSGPPGSVLSGALNVLAKVNGLVEGTYVFELKVTDELGAAHLDSVKVIVVPAPNQTPVANAGPDQVVTLPGDITLDGSAADADGDISSYAWKKIAGPSTYTFSATNVAAPIISNLVAGIYEFELTVTDDDGGIDKDTVKATINNKIDVGAQRVLIDAGLNSLITNSPDQWGKYWNNFTDARSGFAIANAVTITNSPTTIKLEVIKPTGSTATYDLNTRTSNTVGIVGDYPASATNDNAVAHSSITNGSWKIHGLSPNLSYVVKFWGSMPMAGNRTIQIKTTDDVAWKDYNSSLNYNFDSSAIFKFTGRTEITFNIRVKSGASYGYINVIDITINGEDTAGLRKDSSIKSQANRLTRQFQQSGLNNGSDQFHIEQSGAFPNPTVNRSTVTINNKYRGTIEIVVCNMYGLVLKQITGDKLQEIFNQPINLSGYSPGVYHIKIIMKDKIEIMRIIRI
jgi:hypothetical protein